MGNESYLSRVFGAEGLLANAFPGYVPRAGQVALATAVDKAIATGTHLLAEAPTGTGKGVAYSVPAIFHAVHRRKKVLIATANIALQHQLVDKDLPMLQKIAPWPFTFALVKGRNNYLCIDKYLEHKASKFKDDEDTLSVDDKRHLPILEAWAGETVQDVSGEETGDITEIPDFEPSPALWKKFSVTSDDCKERCRFKDNCFANRALDRAHDVDLVVTNYHMVCAHIALAQETGFDMVLPPFDIFIGDEFHKIGDIAREFFGFTVTQESIKRLARQVGKLDPTLGENLRRTNAKFFHVLEILKKDRARYKARVKPENLNANEVEAWAVLKTSLEAALARSRKHVKACADEHAETVGAAREGTNERLGAGERIQKRLGLALANLSATMTPPPDARLVCYLDEDEKQRLSVRSKLVYASDALTPGLFRHRMRYRDRETRETIEKDDPVTVIGTSATLATGDGDFTYASIETGAPEGTTTLVAESPFDWENQLLFICPDGMRIPSDEGWRDDVVAHMERTLALAGGRTLGLFTSRKSMQHTYDEVRAYCRSQKLTLLKQGDGGRRELLQKFKTDITSVLFGLESFWAGVDVPGEALSVVVIDKLPFPTPDDPILDVLSETEPRWFDFYSIPRAIIAFKQGAGRAVRSLACKAVVVCLDRRILDKGYGKKFLKALPPGTGKTKKLDTIAEWLGTPLPEEEMVTRVTAALPEVKKEAAPSKQLALAWDALESSPAWDALDLPPAWDAL